MPKLTTTHHDFLQDRQERTFTDVLNDPRQPVDTVLDFSICEGRRQLPPDAESHAEAIPLAGAASESDAQPPVDDLFSLEQPRASKLTQHAAEAAARVSAEQHGWKQTGKKGWRSGSAGPT